MFNNKMLYDFYNNFNEEHQIELVINGQSIYPHKIILNYIPFFKTGFNVTLSFNYKDCLGSFKINVVKYFFKTIYLGKSFINELFIDDYYELFNLCTFLLIENNNFTIFINDYYQLSNSIFNELKSINIFNLKLNDNNITMYLENIINFYYNYTHTYHTFNLDNKLNFNIIHIYEGLILNINRIPMLTITNSLDYMIKLELIDDLIKDEIIEKLENKHTLYKSFIIYKKHTNYSNYQTSKYKGYY